MGLQVWSRLDGCFLKLLSSFLTFCFVSCDVVVGSTPSTKHNDDGDDALCTALLWLVGWWSGGAHTHMQQDCLSTLQCIVKIYHDPKILPPVGVLAHAHEA